MIWVIALTLLVVIYTGDTIQANKWFHFSLHEPVSHTALHEARNDWIQQRRSLSTNDQGKHIIHYYTIASNNQTELQNLLFSAQLWGIDLQVKFLSSILLVSDRCLD